MIGYFHTKGKAKIAKISRIKFPTDVVNVVLYLRRVRPYYNNVIDVDEDDDGATMNMLDK